MTKNWKILNLKRQSLDDLVIEITYECVIVDGNYRERKVGSVQISGDTTDNSFIPFDDLTEEVVYTWLVDNLTSETMLEIETNLESMIADKQVLDVNKPKRGLPWGKR